MWVRVRACLLSVALARGCSWSCGVHVRAQKLPRDYPQSLISEKEEYFFSHADPEDDDASSLPTEVRDDHVFLSSPEHKLAVSFALANR